MAKGQQLHCMTIENMDNDKHDPSLSNHHPVPYVTTTLSPSKNPPSPQLNSHFHPHFPSLAPNRPILNNPSKYIQKHDR